MMLDGAMGTMIQKLRLNEDDFRGRQMRGWSCICRAIDVMH